MTKDVTVNPILVKALLALTVVILFIVSINFFLTQIVQTNAKINGERQSTQSLRQKASALSQSSGGVAESTEGVLLALPQSDSSLMGISQIKTSASLAGAVIDNISYGSVTKVGTDITKINFGVDLSGDLTSLESFLLNLKQSAPLATINSLRLAQETTASRLSVSVSYYWAPLPAQLPELEKPLTMINEEDLELLTRVSALRMPNIDTSALAPSFESSTGSGRPNVFEIAQ